MSTGPVYSLLQYNATLIYYIVETKKVHTKQPQTDCCIKKFFGNRDLIYALKHTIIKETEPYKTMETAKYSHADAIEGNKKLWLTDLNSETMIAYIKGIIKHIEIKIQDADIQDITQNVLLNANQAINTGQFKGESTLKTWVFRITTNATLTYLRGQRNKIKYYSDANPHEIADTSSLSDSPEDILIMEEQHNILTELISKLKPVEQEILKLRLAGKTTNEIAGLLQKPPVTVRVILHRIMKKLKNKNTPT